MRLDSLHSQSVALLSSMYSAEEAGSIVGVMFVERLSLERYTYILEPSTEIPEEESCAFLSDISRIAAGEPMQYVLGYEWFCSRKFKVCPSVLIPRPETEEMVCGIIADNALRPATRVLDLCTGSGCIAWTLSLDLKGSYVTAVDISREALSVAAAQFDLPGPHFVCADVLDGSSAGIPCLQDAVQGEFDLIVSNPPYVLESQKSDMQTNVLAHEPHLALFVSDSDPLVFYKRIAAFSIKRLARDGMGYVEINDALGEATAAVFKDVGFERVEILRDAFGRDRVVRFSH